MISGASPFRRNTPADTIAAIIHAPPDLHNPEAPHSLERIILRCLHKNRAERFETAADLAFALELVVGELRRADVSLPRTSAAGAQANSIAVLPFADMSPGRDQDYLCEGIAEEVIGALT